jgi:hypothetical protein
MGKEGAVMTAPKRSKRKRRTQRKRTDTAPPDLSLIVEALWDAYGFVWTANEVIAQGDYYGPEQVVLHQGVEAIKQVCERLDAARRELSRVQP